MREGSYIPLNDSDPNVISYLRSSKEGTVLIVLNFSATPQNRSFDLAKQGFASAKAKGLLQNAASAPDGTLKGVHLEAYGVYIGRITN